MHITGAESVKLCNTTWFNCIDIARRIVYTNYIIKLHTLTCLHIGSRILPVYVYRANQRVVS